MCDNLHEPPIKIVIQSLPTSRPSSFTLVANCLNLKPRKRARQVLQCFFTWHYAAEIFRRFARPSNVMQHRSLPTGSLPGLLVVRNLPRLCRKWYFVADPYRVAYA